MKADVIVMGNKEGELPDFSIVFCGPYGNDVPFDITRLACECNINVNKDSSGNIAGLHIFGITPKEGQE